MLNCLECRFFTGSGSAGWGDTSVRGGDGVKGIYQDFVKRVPGLDESTAPALFAYLKSH
jgi:hypothetical protein